MQQPLPSRSETSVAVIDEPTLFAESLRTALALEGYDTSMVSAQTATLTPELLLDLNGRPPQIAILDLDLNETRNALTILRPLAAAGTQVVVVTASDERTRWGECLSNGALRVVRKTAPLADILDVVRRIATGLPVMSADERGALLEEWHACTKATHEILQRFARLDELECWVLARLRAGYAMHEIVRDGPLSQATVYRAVASVVDKLDVSSWLEAVSLTDEHGWSPAAAAG
jgi:two-component system, NarL family, nitrate/nitrite response regulator NarL